MEQIEKFKLGLDDIQKGNYMTNKAILKAFENAASYQSDKVGYGIETMDERVSTWILLEWKIKVIKRPIYGEVEARTWPRKIYRIYTYRDYELYDKNGELCAIGTSKWFLYDFSKRHVIRPDDKMKESYDIIEKNVFENEDIEKIEEPKQYEFETEYKVLRKDIDFNGHMHNLNYLDLAIETLPEKVYLNNNFNSIRITYIREIKLGEKVKCKYGKINDKHIISIFSEDETIKHAIIELGEN